MRCNYLNPHVTIVFDGVSLSVDIDGLHQNFERSHFESQTYTHCSVFRRLAAGTIDLLPTVASLAVLRQHDVPPWFHYKDGHYYQSLQTLTARHLLSVVLTLVSCKTSCRTKKDATEAILSHFFSRHTELSGMDDEVLSMQLSSVPLPTGCILMRTTLIVAHFCDTYSELVAAALRRPPELTAFSNVEDVICQASTSMDMPWLTAPLPNLSQSLCVVKSSDISSCVHQQPQSVRCLIDTQSHRKLCNGIVHAIHLCTLQLHQAGSNMLANIVTAILPFVNVSKFTNGEIVRRILCSEFGPAIIDCLSYTCSTPKEMRSLHGKMQCSALKQQSLDATRAVHLAHEWEWPSC